MRLSPLQAQAVCVALEYRANALHTLADQNLQRTNMQAHRIYLERANALSALASDVRRVADGSGLELRPA